MTKAEWQAEAARRLAGRRIISVHYFTEEEMEAIGWSKAPVGLTLDDGTTIYPSKDDEGNEGGALHGCDPAGEMFCLPTL